MPAIPTSVSPRNNYPTCPIFFRSPPRYFIEVRSENVPTEFYEVILKTGYPSPHMGNSERLKEYLFKQLRERNASLQSIASSNVGVRTLNRTSPSSPDQIEEELDPIKISLEENVRSRFEEEIRGVVEDVRRSVEEDIRPLISDVEDGIRRNEDGLRRLDDGIRRNEDGLRRLDDGIKRVEDGIRRNEDGLRRLDDGIKRVEDGIKRVDDGIKRVDDGIKRVDDGLRHLDDGIKRVDDGLRHLDDGIKRVDDGLRRNEESLRRIDDRIRAIEEDQINQRREMETLHADHTRKLEEIKRRIEGDRAASALWSEKVDEIWRELAEQSRDTHMGNASLVEEEGIVVDMYQGDDLLEVDFIESRIQSISLFWKETVKEISYHFFSYLRSFLVNHDSAPALNVHNLAIQTLTDESFGSISPSRVIEG